MAPTRNKASASQRQAATNPAPGTKAVRSPKPTKVLVKVPPSAKPTNSIYNRIPDSIDLKDLFMQNCSVVLDSSVVTNALKEASQLSKSISSSVATRRKPQRGAAGMSKQQKIIDALLPSTRVTRQQIESTKRNLRSNKVTPPKENTRVKALSKDVTKPSTSSRNKSKVVTTQPKVTRVKKMTQKPSKINQEEKIKKEVVSKEKKRETTKRQSLLEECIQQNKKKKMDTENTMEDQGPRKKIQTKNFTNKKVMPSPMKEQGPRKRIRSKNSIDENVNPSTSMKEQKEDSLKWTQSKASLDTSCNSFRDTSDSDLKFEPKSFYGITSTIEKKTSKTSLTTIKPVESKDVYTFETPTTPKKAKRGGKRIKGKKVLTSVENRADDPSSPDYTKKFFTNKRPNLADKKEVIATVSKGKFNLNFKTGNHSLPQAATKPKRNKRIKPDLDVPLTTAPTIYFLRKADTQSNQKKVTALPQINKNRTKTLQQIPPEIPPEETVETQDLPENESISPPLNQSIPAELGFEEDFERSMEMDSLNKKEGETVQENTPILSTKTDITQKPGVVSSPEKNFLRSFFITSQQNQIQGDKGDLGNWIQPVATSTPLAKSSKRILEADQDNQMVIDAGQKDIDAYQCPSCKMVYAKGKPTDEKVHHRHHNNHYTNTLKFKGWKKETVVREYPDGRVIVVTASDPKFMLHKVEEVHELIDKELGFQPIRTTQTHQKVYLFISHNMEIAGLVTVDAISKAYPLVSHSDDMTTKEECKVLRNGYYCSQDSVPALCGIIRLWTAPNMRRKKVATRILDCICHSFIHRHYLQMNQIAFSDPTTDGHQFALAYSKSGSYLIV